MDYGKEVDKFNIEVQDEDIVVELPDTCKYDSNWSIVKYMIVSDIRDYVANKNVKFVEVYRKKEENKEEEKKEEAEEEVKEETEEKETEEKEEEKKEEETKEEKKEE